MSDRHRKVKIVAVYLGGLDGRAQFSDFALDTGVDLFDLELLTRGRLSHSTYMTKTL